MRNAYLRRQQHHRRVQAKVQGHVQHRDAFLASATLVSRPQIRRALTDRDWQTELWGFFDRVGEVRFAVRWLANAVSRCGLFIGEQPQDATEPVPVKPSPDNEAARALLEHLHYGHVGQAEMLRRMALHLSLPGETFLVALEPDIEQGIEDKRWYVASANEIKINSRGSSTFTLPDTGATVKLSADKSTIIRMWIPHPNKGWEPDSAISATLPTLREVEALSQHIQASVESRLAGAGLLLIPNSTSVVSNPRAANTEGGANPAHMDDFMSALTEAMITPLQDRGDASSVVPVVARVPDESVGKVEHISFATPLSEKTIEMRRDALERFAAGADLPREVVTGTGSANHWGAWQLEESSIKLHVEPLIGVICDALTQQYLWPGLAAMGVPDPKRFVVWYDPSELSHRPNKATEAQALWNMGVLSDEALLRETGFNPSDAATPAQRAEWLQFRAAITNPGLFAPVPAPGGTAALGSTPGSTSQIPANDGRSLPAPTPSPVPALGGAATTPPPAGVDNEAATATWWLCTVEQVALRALALAGKRLFRDVPRSERDRDSEVRAVHLWDVHTIVTSARPAERLLQGAFDTAHAVFADGDCAFNTVRAYCHHLIDTGQPHRREYLATWLSREGCWPSAPSSAPALASETEE